MDSGWNSSLKQKAAVRRWSAALHDLGIEFVHDKTSAEMRLEEMSAADMVKVTMSEDDIFNQRGIKACIFDVLETHP